jgi:hypothetical protein
MAFVTRQFDKYVLYYISRKNPGQLAEIDCFGEDGRAGIIYFYKKKNLPQNRETVNGIYIYYHIDRFSDVMETLREEAPLTLALHDDTGVAYVMTGYEPIGEGEPAP